MINLFINWAPSPEIFNIGGFSIRWYSLLFALGFILAYLIMQRIFKREKVDVKILDKLTIYTFIGLILGLRLGHCLFYEWDYYSKHFLEIFLPFKGVPFTNNFEFTGFQGLASHGGAIGLIIAMILFKRKYKINLWWLLDRIVIVVPLAGAMVRIGNLMNSEIIGAPTDVPWAFIFTKVDNLARHPSQLYESLLYLDLFVIMLLLYFKTKLKKQQGKMFALFLIQLFTIRFVIEFFKAPQEDFEKDMILNMGQILSIPFIIGGFLILIFKKKNLKTLENDNKS